MSTQGITIDVVIPAFNEERHIGDCLDHVLRQDYPAELTRVWIVDAGSTDATAEEARERAEREPRVTVVEGHGRLNAAQAVNLGVKQGSAELIARVDAHTSLYPDYLTRAVAALTESEPDVACVGAQPEQIGDTAFGEAVALARASRFGVGSSVYADRRARAFVDTVQAGVYRRSVLEQLNGFATGMLVGEDEELNWRLRKAGYRILLDTSVRFRYTTRSSWSGVFRQHRNYGHSRVRVITAHPDFARPYHFAPALLVSALVSLTALGPLSGLARKALAALAGLYGTAVVGAAVVASGRDRPGLVARVAACFTALHLGYGVGMLEGAALWLRARAGFGEPPTAVRRR